MNEDYKAILSWVVLAEVADVSSNSSEEQDRATNMSLNSDSNLLPHSEAIPRSACANHERGFFLTNKIM